MNDIEDRLLSLKKKIDSLSQKLDRAKWEKEQLEKELLEKYGLKTAKDAEKAAKKLEAEAAAIREELEKELTKIETDHKDLLGMV